MRERIKWLILWVFFHLSYFFAKNKEPIILIASLILFIVIWVCLIIVINGMKILDD